MELGQAVCELVLLAYPEFSEEGRDRLARGHFTDAIRSQTIREGIFRARPTTLDEAIRAALATENFERMEEQRSDRRMLKNCRASETTSDPFLAQIKQVVAEQMNQYRGPRPVDMRDSFTERPSWYQKSPQN